MQLQLLYNLLYSSCTFVVWIQ